MAAKKAPPPYTKRELVLATRAYEQGYGDCMTALLRAWEELDEDAPDEKRMTNNVKFILNSQAMYDIPPQETK